MFRRNDDIFFWVILGRGQYPDIVASIDRMIDELERIWKETFTS
jgi:hypothetical protein